MNRKNLLLATGFSLALLSQSALAGFYVSGTSGLSAPEDDDYLDNAIGFSGQAGYQFNPYFSVQGGGTYLGSFDFAEENNYWDDENLSIYGAEATMVVSVPVAEAFSFYAKAGLFIWGTEAESSYSDGDTDVTYTSDDDGVDAVYGVGGEFRLNPNFSIIGGANFYEMDDMEINYYAAGVKFRF